MNLRAAVSDAPVEPESLHAASRCVNGQPRYNWTSSFFDTRALDLPHKLCTSTNRLGHATISPRSDVDRCCQQTRLSSRRSWWRRCRRRCGRRWTGWCPSWSGGVIWFWGRRRSSTAGERGGSGPAPACRMHWLLTSSTAKTESPSAGTRTSLPSVLHTAPFSSSRSLAERAQEQSRESEPGDCVGS